MSTEAARAHDLSVGAAAITEIEQLRPGYKRTDVGVIPEDWEVRSMRDLGQIKTGPFGTLLKAEEYSGAEGVPLVSVGEIRAGSFKVSDQTPRVPVRVIRRLPQYVLRSGDIVFGRKGAVERSALVTESEDGWFLGSDGMSLRPAKAVLAPYLAWQFQRHEMQEWLVQNAIGTTMASLNQGILSRVQVPYAPILEQRAIAAALSDMDRLLGAQESLIAKKRAIKQAAMHQLATGESRLPGFSGKWEAKRLGEHVKFLRTGVNSRAELIGEGSVKYLHYGDIHTSALVRLDPRGVAMPCLSEERARTLDRLRDGDLVLVDASEDLDGIGKSVEIAGVSGIEVVAGLHTIAARFDEKVLANGFKAYLQFQPAFRDHLRRLAAGTKVYATNRMHVASAEIPLPPTKEQLAIATVLSDMDAGIAALERRRDKARAIKQGMMQQLLTGRVRIVEPVESSEHAA